MRVDGNRFLAISCDAAGAVGSKPQDTVKADPRLVGKMTARVALMELLAIGADPVALSGTFSVEPKPTGDSVIEGIRQELGNAHLTKVRIICSSEKNFRVKQTGIGITAIGLVSNSALKIGRCEPRDDIVALGDLHLGHEVIQAERSGQIADTLDVIRLRKNPFVHELIPVGSKGILYEATVMANDSKLAFQPSTPQPTNMKKSAGPATVLLIALRKGSFSQVRNIVGGKPIRGVGTMQLR